MAQHIEVLKEKNCQPRILYPVKTSFRNEGEIKTFLDEGKQRYVVTRRPVCSKRMASRSSRNKKEAIKERMLQYQERRKNMVSKNIDKYNEFFLVPLEL